LAFNLLSVSKLDSAGAEIMFGNSLCRVTKGGSEVLRADLEQKVWVIKGTQHKAGIHAFSGMVCSLPAVIEPTSKELASQGISPSRTKASWDLWHRRLTELELFISRSVFSLDVMELTLGFSQVGMTLGFATALPVNWYLIKYKIKEPCV